MNSECLRSDVRTANFFLRNVTRIYLVFFDQISLTGKMAAVEKCHMHTVVFIILRRRSRRQEKAKKRVRGFWIRPKNQSNDRITVHLGFFDID